MAKKPQELTPGRLRLLGFSQKFNYARLLIQRRFLGGFEFYAELPRLFLRPKCSE
jgi:hypothetical protein